MKNISNLVLLPSSVSSRKQRLAPPLFRLPQIRDKNRLALECVRYERHALHLRGTTTTTSNDSQKWVTRLRSTWLRRTDQPILRDQEFPETIARFFSWLHCLSDDHRKGRLRVIYNFLNWWIARLIKWGWNSRRWDFFND